MVGSLTSGGRNFGREINLINILKTITEYTRNCRQLEIGFNAQKEI